MAKLFENAELTDLLLGILIGLLAIAMRWIAKKAQLDAAQAEILEEMLVAAQKVRRRVVDALVAANADGVLTEDEKEAVYKVAKEELLANIGPKAKELVLSWGEQRLRSLITLALSKAGVSLHGANVPAAPATPGN